MKVILDANVLISYLLAPDDTRTVVQAVEVCFSEHITLFVPPELIDELKTTLRDVRLPEQPHCTDRVGQST